MAGKARLTAPPRAFPKLNYNGPRCRGPSHSMRVRGLASRRVAQRTLLALGLILAAIAGLLCSTGASAQRTAVVLPEGSTWGDDASGLRGQDGKRFVFLCPADGHPERAW